VFSAAKFSQLAQQTEILSEVLDSNENMSTDDDDLPEEPTINFTAGNVLTLKIVFFLI
jgi:hypothetical protein